MIQQSWTSPDGVVYPLTDTTSGVWLNDAGVEGLGTPQMVEFTSESSAIDGQRLTGFRARAREVFWPVVIDATAASWQALQSAFWAALPFGRNGVWRVTAPDGSVRALTARFVSEDGPVYGADPSRTGVEVRGVNLVADDPFWRGPQVLQTFQTAQNAQPFFNATGTHVLNLMSSSTSATATVSNPGEVDAWPLWTVTGPATSFTIGVGSTVISATMPLLVGESVQVNTDPTVQVARKIVGGVSTVLPFSAFTSIQFARVPSGESVPLTIQIQGAGSVSVQFDPGFRRAF
jgi:hypothetical protein